MLCDVGKVGQIRHPGAGMLTYRSTDISHGRCRLMLDEYHVVRVLTLVTSVHLVLWRFSDKKILLIICSQVFRHHMATFHFSYGNSETYMNDGK